VLQQVTLTNEGVERVILCGPHPQFVVGEVAVLETTKYYINTSHKSVSLSSI